ncbi:MAG: hypothetical protein ACI9UJ_000518 [bacterium]|jgi:hypothetical protein
MIRNFKKSIILVLLLMGSGSTLVAQEDCKEKISKASELFEQGQLQKVIDLITPCATSADNPDKWQIYKLLAEAYLAQGLEVEARASAVKMKEMYPTIGPNQKTDSKNLINLLSEIDVIPKFSLGLSFVYGANATVPRITGIYSAGSYTKTYRPKLGSQFGVVLGYNFNKNHSVDLNIVYNIKKYELDYTWGANEYLIKENLSYFDFPIVYRYSLSTTKKVRIGFVAGAYTSVLLNSNNDLSILGTSENRELEHYGSVKRRNKIALGGILGLGLNIKQGNGHISVDARYNRSFTSITKTSNRYENATLIYDYLYLDDDILLDNLSFTVGYHFYINYAVVK